MLQIITTLTTLRKGYQMANEEIITVCETYSMLNNQLPSSNHLLSISLIAPAKSKALR